MVRGRGHPPVAGHGRGAAPARAEELAAEQERYALEAVRLERAVIARELHDVVAHCMTVIVIQARAGQQLLARDPDAAAEALDAISASALEAEHDVAALVELVNPEQSRPLTRTLLDELVRGRSRPGSASPWSSTATSTGCRRNWPSRPTARCRRP